MTDMTIPSEISVFAPGLYTCSITLQPMTDQQTRVLSVSMTNLLVKADLVGTVFTGEQVGTRLPIEPGLYSDQAELLLSNLHPSAEFTVYGPPTVLSNMEVKNSDFMEDGHSFHSFINSYQMMFCTLFALLAGTAIVIIGGSPQFVTLSFCRSKNF
ncbi:hypothetical protein XENOCAPTIV_012741 [Xenoophorus captivus]|uniref:Uncharacterized protein n=1 Tax=Xenoophorus captivus TaxID=1517983 RepID=A0ABV0R037_9TELE